MGFSDWYALNKEKLAETRRQKYALDPNYRELVKSRSKEQRERQRAENPPPNVQGMDVAEICASLGIKPWTLHSWRQRKYYPEPTRVSGRPVFTERQAHLLGLIKHFFEEHPNRAAGNNRQKLQVIVNVIANNWS